MQNQMSIQEKIAACGGDELPTKAGGRFVKPVEISREEFFALKPTFLGSFWGAIRNDSCNLYKAEDGRLIEVNTSFGWLSHYYIESKV